MHSRVTRAWKINSCISAGWYKSKNEREKKKKSIEHHSKKNINEILIMNVKMSLDRADMGTHRSPELFRGKRSLPFIV